LELLPIRRGQESPVTEEEVKVLIAQGTEYGTFHETEQEMVEGVFRLGDHRVSELMRPRGRITLLDVESSWEENRAVIAGSTYSRYPLVEGDLDRLIGVVHVRDLFVAATGPAPADLRALARKPLVVPEITRALDLLETFRASREEVAFVVDEHGGVEGMLTTTDLVEAVVGDLPGPGHVSEQQITHREDGTWLVDGSLRVSDLVDALQLRKVPGEESGFSTVAGLVLAHLRQIPKPGDAFEVDRLRFEVIDMDRNRIDKVLISRAS
jgi:putative hemolysin